MQLLPFFSCLLAAVGVHASPDPMERIVSEALKSLDIQTIPTAVASATNARNATTLATVAASTPTAHIAVAAVDDPAYWLKDIKKQGLAAFNDNPSGYKVWRNVKDYGAKGKLLLSKYLMYNISQSYR
jgi:hypothetical protein